MGEESWDLGLKLGLRAREEEEKVIRALDILGGGNGGLGDSESIIK